MKTRILLLFLMLAIVVPFYTADAQVNDSRYIWLENIDSNEVLNWADKRTAQTVKELSSFPIYDSLLQDIKAGLESSKFIPKKDITPPAFYDGPFVYRYRDPMWLRQPAVSYEGGENNWNRILNFKSLSQSEGMEYKLSSFECLPPDYNKCLLLLSNKGTSRFLTLKEFDMERRQVVKNGFNLDQAETKAYWRDANSVYITTKPMGWADHVKIWKRGERLKDAGIMNNAPPADSGLKLEKKGDYLMLLKKHHQYDIEYFLIRDDNFIPLPMPGDVKEITFVRGQMVLQLRSEWKPANQRFPSGSLIGIDFQKYLDGSREFKLIMPSSKAMVVDLIWSTKNLLIVRALEDLNVRMVEFTFEEGSWKNRTIAVPENGRVTVQNNSKETDTYYFSHQDFLSPRKAYVREASGEVKMGAYSTPSFDASPYIVDRLHATSTDSTQIPYFVVHRKDMEFDGNNPIIISGYGGNGISILPQYLTVIGPAWLNHGGVYVLASIRGGCEYGPEWHYAVRREKRQLAFDDFQSVAEDLISRKITSPKMIGTTGGSNGGILVTISFIQRSDLYGAVVAYNGVMELQRCSSMSGSPPVGERGDGQDSGDWAYMKHYSPFHNLEPDKSYPPSLLLANRVDDIVHPCHSRKFTAKMENLGYNNVHYYETEGGGHGKNYINREHAMIYSFFLKNLHPSYKE